MEDIFLGEFPTEYCMATFDADLYLIYIMQLYCANKYK